MCIWLKPLLTRFYHLMAGICIFVWITYTYRRMHWWLLFIIMILGLYTFDPSLKILIIIEHLFTWDAVVFITSSMWVYQVYVVCVCIVVVLPLNAWKGGAPWLISLFPVRPCERKKGPWPQLLCSDIIIMATSTMMCTRVLSHSFQSVLYGWHCPHLHPQTASLAAFGYQHRKKKVVESFVCTIHHVVCCMRCCTKACYMSRGSWNRRAFRLYAMKTLAVKVHSL